MPAIRTAIAISTLALAACQTVTGAQPMSRADLAAPGTDGVPLLVSSTCRSCHAVTADAISPHPRAPTFADIANTPGLTRETLTAYLGDAHNYPDQMDVDLDAADIAIIADYMLTLQSEDYVKRPS